MIKKIIKVKILILLSLFSIKPAVASNYNASSKTKITIKTAKSKGYKKRVQITKKMQKLLVLIRHQKMIFTLLVIMAQPVHLRVVLR